MRTAARWILGLTLLLTGASAVWGGSMLVAGRWDLDLAWLQHTPFESWTLPGLATILFPGVCVALAGLVVLLRRPGDRSIAMSAGVGLMLWVLVELVWLRIFHPVMHPLIFAVGLLAVGLAWLLPHAPRPGRADAGAGRTVGAVASHR